MTTLSTNRMRAGTQRLTKTGRLPIFYAVTLAFVAFLLFTLQEPLQFSYAAWLPGYEQPAHRVHHVMIGSILALLVLGVLVQLYRPSRRVGAFVLSSLVVGTVFVATVIGAGIEGGIGLAVFVIPLIVLGLLHPTVRQFRPSRATMDRRMMVLALVGAIPLILYGIFQLNLQMTMVDDHVAFEHYLMMAGGAFTIGLGAILAAFRPIGWRALVYGIGALAVVVAVASIVFPGGEQGTNFGLVGGALVVLWAIVFVAVAELRARNTDPREGKPTV